jgi:hypothetical protein
MGSVPIIIIAVAHGKLLEGVELIEDGKSLIDCVVIAGIPYVSKDQQSSGAPPLQRRTQLES